jgi:hypothetical protein
MGSIVPLFGSGGALRWIGVERYKRAMYGGDAHIPSEAVSEIPSEARDSYSI